MRRTILFAAVVIAALVAVVALPTSVARTQGQSEAGPAIVLDTARYTLGDLVEGDAPPLERLPPDVLPAAPRDVTLEGIPAPEGYTADFRHYLTSAEINEFLDELAAYRPDLVTVVEIGRSALGRPLMAARVTNAGAPGAVEDRPAMYIDGQHHAREMVSNAVALYTLWWLVRFHGADPLVTRLLDTRVVYIVPTINPDGNDIALTDNQDARKTANPRACDDDGDGRFDEDPSRGYGYGAHTLSRYTFNQDWADAHPDDPFVGNWMRELDPRHEPEDIGRFTGAFGGTMRPIPAVDRDRDGRQNEDELGGTDPNRNYDFEWDAGDRQCRFDTYRGAAAWSETETRAVRGLVAGTPHLSTALSYHSGTDLILHPWGYSTNAPLPDAWLFERLGRKGSQLTEANGFPGSPHTWTARGLYDAAGSTMDYLYGTAGVYTLSPEVYGDSSRTYVARVGATGTFTVGTSTAVAYNPRAGDLLASTERWNRFALYLLAATPNIELNAVTVDGNDLVITFGNDGVIPVDLRSELRGPDGALLATHGPVRLGLDVVTTTWRLPLVDRPREGLRVTMTAVQPAGTVPHEVERAHWLFDVVGDAVALREGAIVAPADLAQYFPDGWWADDRWDEPGRYHRPGGMPLPIDPPATATPTLPPRRTATPTITVAPPTTSPSATVTPSSPPTATTTPTPSPTHEAPSVTPGVATASVTATAPPTTVPTDTPTARGWSYLPLVSTKRR